MFIFKPIIFLFKLIFNLIGFVIVLGCGVLLVQWLLTL